LSVTADATRALPLLTDVKVSFIAATRLIFVVVANELKSPTAVVITLF